MNRVLILGATSPIARALALRFASDGAQLYLAARNADEARRVAEDVGARAGVTALSGTFDASDFASHDEFVRHAATALGGLDGVVVCFGTLGDEDSAQTDPGEALATIHQNFTGAVSLITLAARHLEQQRSGFIIVIGSVAGERGRKKNYVYGSAKGALATFAQGLRGRLAASGVHVMTVKLGTVDTRGRAADDCAGQSRRPDLRGVSKTRRSRLCAVVLALDHGRDQNDSRKPLQTRQLLAG
jgi:decaprenylphospho-beta-D-erythro-pentofuranosid-2-ulose 2-reductase